MPTTTTVRDVTVRVRFSDWAWAYYVRVCLMQRLTGRAPSIEAVAQVLAKGMSTEVVEE